MPAASASLPVSDALLDALLEMAAAGAVLYAPCHDAAGALTDLAFVRLNPAAQQLLALPARPQLSCRQFFSRHPEALAFHLAAFLATGECRQAPLALPAGSATCCATARQVAGLLLVSYEPGRAAAAGWPALQQEVEQLRHTNAALRGMQQTAAQGLAEERAVLAQVFAQTPALIALLAGPEFVFTFVNPAFQRFFPERDLVGRPLAQALPEACEQGYVELLQEVSATGRPFVGKASPLRFRTAGGQLQESYFDFTYEPYGQGENRGIFMFAFEVTDQVLARRERASQQQQLQAVFEQAPVAISVFRGPNYVLDVVNPSMAAMWGRAPADIVGQPFLEALPELQSQGLRELLDEVRRTGVAYTASDQPFALARHLPGEVGYYNFVYQPLRDEQGRVESIACVALEVTEQVQARRLVEERELYFRQMADSAPAMLWVTNAAGYCTYLNQRWYEFTGQTQAEALGTGWVGAIHPADAAAAEATFLDADARRVTFQGTYRLRRHDGTYRWTLDHGLPRFSASGEYEGMVGTVVDVHQQKLADLALQRLTGKLRFSRDEAEALNTELRVANEQLTRTNVDLDNFIYTASHDLKAPITNIEGLLGALREQLPAEVQADEQVLLLLGMMQSAVERFQLTIAQLSDISQLQLTYTQPAASLDLTTLVEDVRLDLASVLRAAGAHLTVDVRACPTLVFAPKNLRSIIYNLLSNAVKYGHPDRAPQVLLRTYRTAQAAVLEVHDNGLGLSEGQQSKLFGMFQRLHDHVEGSGIGLYMVKKIVDNAGGTIAVSSQPGVGSVFTVTLPA